MSSYSKWLANNYNNKVILDLINVRTTCSVLHNLIWKLNNIDSNSISVERMNCLFYVALSVYWQWSWLVWSRIFLFFLFKLFISSFIGKSIKARLEIDTFFSTRFCLPIRNSKTFTNRFFNSIFYIYLDTFVMEWPIMIKSPNGFLSLHLRVKDLLWPNSIDTFQI